MAYFPMFVSLENKKCIIIGGGKVAKRKADTLLSYGADVTVIAPEIKYEFEGCSVIKRKVNDDDIKNCFMVIAAADSRDVNERTAMLCCERGIHINRADSSEGSSFIFGASFKRNNMTIAVNSGENDPAKSKEVKNKIMNYIDNNTIRIGTRKSRLAKIQTDIVVNAIKNADSSIICEVVELSTDGDENLNKNLRDFGGKGAFTGTFERALAEGKIDIAVHSGKDLPIELGEGLEIIATPKREAANDVLVTMRGKKLDENSVIGTGSERRKLQTAYKTKSISGNVETRLMKMEKGEYDGVILAYAGLKRLGLDNVEKYDYKIYKTDEMYPAPCQGIIAVEGRKDCKFRKLIENINDKNTYISFLAERKIVTEADMGCNFPVGIYSFVEGDKIHLNVMYLGENRKYFEKVTEKENAEKAAKELALEIKRFL